MSHVPSCQKDVSIGSYKRERDRYVFFAFAGADVLIELDSKGIICFATGALGALGRSPAELHGSRLDSLICVEDRARAAGFLSDMRQSRRKHAVQLGLRAADGSTIPARVSGYRVPEMSDHGFISLSLIDGGTGTNEARERRAAPMSASSFAAVAADRLRKAGSTGKDIDLTMIELGNLGSLRARVGVDEAQAFFDDIIEQLRPQSLGGDTVAALGADKLGIIHDRQSNLDGVSERIAERSRAFDPTGEGINVSSRTLELESGQLSESDAVRSLVYTINQFAKSGAEINLRSLRDGYRAMLKDTMGRVEAFRAVIEQGDFRVAYQPIVTMASGAIHHYEALARFGGPGDGTSPFKLIQFAEDVGVISEFDRAMCRRVLDTLESANGLAPSVAVNLSTRSLTDEKSLRALRALLKEYPDLKQTLLLEVTESYSIQDLPKAKTALAALREDGYRICLDDFGVGATNIDYLRQLPVDFVKIDGSYVRGALTSPKTRALLNAIVELCKKLQVKTIAEYVEDEETATLLKRLGVDLAQGYLYGKPAPGLPELER